MRIPKPILKEEWELPNKCSTPSNMPSNDLFFCGTSFKHKKNLYQDTDLSIRCVNCGKIHGYFKKGVIPFRLPDDNIGKGRS